MGHFFAERILQILQCGTNPGGGAPKVLVLGLTFKENVPDLRNSKVVDLIESLQAGGCQVAVHDPLADPQEARSLLGVELVADIHDLTGLDCIVGAVAHKAFRRLQEAEFHRLLGGAGVLIDLCAMWGDEALPPGISRRSI